MKKSEKELARQRKYQREYYKRNKKRILDYKRQWRLRNPEKMRKLKRKAHLKLYFKMTLGQYDKLFEKQNGCCAICGKPETRKIRGVVTRLAVDHNHKTGEARGLLCHNCNTKLGVLEENSFIEKAIKYLKRE